MKSEISSLIHPLTAFAVLTALATTARADVQPLRFEVTPYGGYSFGGTFEDEDANVEIPVADDASYGLVFNFNNTVDTQYELIYARHATTADASDVSEIAQTIDLDIDHLQIGGTYRASGERLRPYVAMTIGGSRFSPSFTGGESDTFWSFSIGTGITFRPAERLGVRLEARAWGTLVDSDSSLFCESGPEAALCAIALDGRIFWEIETFAGIVFRF